MMMEYYQKFNLSLMEQCNEPTVVPASVTEPDSRPQETPQDLGTLTVQVTVARGSVPIEGAQVTVTDDSQSDTPVAVLQTDSNGRTPALALPAPSARLSQSPSVARPYSLYHILIEKPGYYPVQLLNIPVFDKISSIQPVSLVPLSEGTVPPGEVIINETPATELYRKE